MGFFEHEMVLRWHVYQTSGANFARPGLDVWTSQVETFVKTSSGTPWHKRALTVLSIVALWKGLYALLLHDYERAVVLFDKGLASEDPTLTSNRARFLARKAEACYGAGKISECIETAQEAFAMASPINQKNTIERVSTLHTVLSQSRWNREQGLRRLGASLTQYHHD
jgi:hypothetical protein